MQTQAAAFQNSMDHLFAELQRLDILLRRGVALARSAAAHSDPNEFRGLVISDDYVDRLLGNVDFLADPWTLDSSTQTFVNAADEALSRKNAEIVERLRQSMHEGGQLSLPHLASIFGLGGEEITIMMIALAPELDTRYETLYAYLQNDVTRKGPSVDLALNLLSTDKESKVRTRQLFSDSNPLLRFGLIRLVEDSYDKQPTLLRRFIKLDDTILHFLLEQPPVLANRTALHQEAVTVENAGLSSESTAELNSLISALQRGGAPHALIHLSSRDDTLLEPAALAIASGLGKSAVTASFPQEGLPQLQQFALLRDAALWNALLVVRLPGSKSALRNDVAEQTSVTSSLQWGWLEATTNPVVVLGSGLDYAALPDDVHLWRLQIEPPDFAARKAMWDDALGRAVDHADPARLADLFPFAHDRILRIVDLAASQAAIRNPSDPVINSSDILTSGRTLTTPNISRFAKPLESLHDWGDLVLPADRLQQLRQIQSRVENRHVVLRDWEFGSKLNRGRGVAVLFTGSPGTGKTLAAEVLANALALQLYQIDLSAVVSKFIGEAEKILSVIFQEAEESQSLLFFDECDAIFGKRTEVKEAHDRYANLEVNYLLQRIEQYEGLVVLATNFQKNMDQAFLRRLQDVVDFPFPDEAARQSIWKTQFSKPSILAADVDLAYLGRQFKLNGGSIRSAALNAAFLSASESGNDSKISMQHLLAAIRGEFKKQGRLVMKSDLGDYAASMQETLP